MMGTESVRKDEQEIRRELKISKPTNNKTETWSSSEWNRREETTNKRKEVSACATNKTHRIGESQWSSSCKRKDEEKGALIMRPESARLPPGPSRKVQGLMEDREGRRERSRQAAGVAGRGHGQ